MRGNKCTKFLQLVGFEITVIYDFHCYCLVLSLAWKVFTKKGDIWWGEFADLYVHYRSPHQVARAISVIRFK